MSLRIGCLTIDAQDCVRLGRFWAEALDWVIVEEKEQAVYLVPHAQVNADTSVPGLLVFRSPDAKVAKNRVHLDLRPDDQAGEVARLEALGAKRVDIGQAPTDPWVVMADPEGNEFCVLSSD